MSKFLPDTAFPLLIVDDDPAVLVGMTAALSSAGIGNIVTCQDGAQVMDLLSKQEFETILLDLTMPHVSGQELLPQIRDAHPEVPVIIVTGVAEVSTAVECMKQGVFDYLVKAVEKTKLVATVGRALQIRALQRENSSLRRHLVDQEFEHPEHFAEIATVDQGMRAALMYVESISATAQTVLITGETGVGKELVAHAIHRASGRTGEMVAVNIAGLEESMFADTLFGHTRGAFTGADQPRKGLIEKASKGTLFLDEIGDLGGPSQVRLLRLLEAREYYPLGSDVARTTDARIIVATNKNLSEEVREGRFRKDLYYRLRMHLVHIPPLRERPEDIPLLLEAFLNEAAHAFGREAPRPSRDLAAFLEEYAFPGNVRELKALVFDAMSRQKVGEITVEAFKQVIGAGQEVPAPVAQGDSLVFPAGFPTLRRAAEFLIEAALKRAGGNQGRAARLLGISPQALSKRLKGG
jgi:DNA-binding NtrC family response regulator